MARTIRNASLDSRAARGRLKLSGKPHYLKIDSGLHLGYRKGQRGGKWVARWYVGNQDYRVETIATADDVIDADGAEVLNFSQAQAKARKLFNDRNRERAGLPALDAGPYTVKQCIEDYLTWADESTKSAADARYKADALILPELGNIECAKLTADNIRDWLKKTAECAPRLRSKRGKAPKYREMPEGEEARLEARRKRQATANRVLTILRAALNMGWREKKIAADDEWRRVKPYAEVGTARPRYLQIDEARRFLNACESDFRELAQGALLTGARYGTLRMLNVDNFNPDSQSIEVRTSKSGKILQIDLNPEGVSFFASHTAGRSPGEQMFKKTDGARWGNGHQTRPMRDACKAARVELKSGESFNILRHTWASHAVMRGTNLLVVAQNMGHTDTRMVEKHYGHLAPSYKKKAIQKGAPIFGITPENVVALEAARR